MLLKQVVSFGQPMAVACDGKCSKAWGISTRPKEQLSEDEDDVVWFSDEELGEAPDDPGTYEGDHAKPRAPSDRMNKWCVRECERCASARMGGGYVAVPDWSERKYNQPWKHHVEEK